MVSLGDFNYAYLAGRLLDGENGEDMYSVVCDIRSLADFLGTTPVDDMIRDIPDSLERRGRDNFRKDCSDVRKIVCNRLDRKDYDLLEGVIYAVGTGLGFLLAMVLFAGLREQLALSRVPKAFEGTPIALVTASLLAMAFMGFSGVDGGLKTVFGL